MARPRGFDREQALGCALDAFWRDGYEATTISGLTDTMGIAAPSLYAAYGDKAHLFAEAAERYVARFRAGVVDSLDTPSAREGLVELLRVTAVAQVAPGTPRGCLVLSEPRLAGEREWLRATVAARVERGQAEGDLAGDVSPAAVAAYLMSVMTGMSSRARDGASAAELDATAALAAAALPGATAG